LKPKGPLGSLIVIATSRIIRAFGKTGLRQRCVGEGPLNRHSQGLWPAEPAIERPIWFRDAGPFSSRLWPMLQLDCPCCQLESTPPIASRTDVTGICYVADGAGRPRSPQGGPAHCGATPSSLAQRCAGSYCGPPWASRGGLSRWPDCSARALRHARQSSAYHSGALDNDPAGFLRAPLLDSTLHGSLVLVGEPVGMHSLEALQNLGRSNARRVADPGAYSLVHVIQHRWTPRHGFAPPIGAAMGWPLLAVPPGYPQSDGKMLEIHWSGRLAGSVQPAAVDPLAELGLGGADLGDQLHRIGLDLKPAQYLLAFLSDDRMRENSSCGMRGVLRSVAVRLRRAVGIGRSGTRTLGDRDAKHGG